jgi:hypothetical protein
MAHMRKVQVAPLIDIGTAPFVVHALQGLRFFLFELHEKAGPLSF